MYDIVCTCIVPGKYVVFIVIALRYIISPLSCMTLCVHVHV